MNIGVHSIFVLLILLVGYSIGRRVGNIEGFNKGLLFSPIELRKDLLISSRCPICNKDN